MRARIPRIVSKPALGLAVLALLAGCAGEPAPPRHLLLITVDTLRADHLGSYGSEYGLTPNLDALARESEVFTAAYAPASFTFPSISAVMTGRYPDELGIWSNRSGIPASVPTLAGELHRRGWRTGAVVSNFVLRETSGLAADFDHYDATFPQQEAVRKWPERIATDTTDAALRMLDELTEEGTPRCFLWVHYQDPHGPYTPPGDRRQRYLELERGAPEGTRLLRVQSGHHEPGAIPRYQYIEEQREVAFYRAGYHAEINYTDEEVGRLLDGFDQRGLTDETMIVFAADHGEGLGEDDYWFAHGEYLSDTQVRVPLFVREPGAPSRRRDDVAALVDLFPTLLRRLVDAAVDPSYIGRDLLAPDAPGTASVPFLNTLGAARVYRLGIVEGDFKFVVSLRDGLWDGRLSRHGRDRVDLSAAAPQIAAEMRRRLDALRLELDRGKPELRQELSPGDEERLRALGYIEVPRPSDTPRIDPGDPP